jgi:hypothetical protein
MATATILHVGKDICQGIPLMGNGGFLGSQSEDSVPAIRKAFAVAGDSFSAITFHSDIFRAVREPGRSTPAVRATSISSYQLALTRTAG